jgi:hypothetical protein
MLLLVIQDMVALAAQSESEILLQLVRLEEMGFSVDQGVIFLVQVLVVPVSLVAVLLFLLSLGQAVIPRGSPVRITVVVVAVVTLVLARLMVSRVVVLALLALSSSLNTTLLVRKERPALLVLVLLVLRARQVQPVR